MTPPHTVANVPSAHLLSDGEMLSRLLITRRPALDIGGDLLLAFLHLLPTSHMPRHPAGVAGDAVAVVVVVAAEDTVAAAAAAADPAAAAAAADASDLRLSHAWPFSALLPRAAPSVRCWYLCDAHLPLQNFD